MSSQSGVGNGIIDSDDKYATKITKLRLTDLLTANPSQLYVGFLMLAAVGYYYLGGALSHASNDDLIGFVSCIIEVIGLLSLQHKIKCRKNVAGISGNTVLMYAFSYISRQVFLSPSEWDLLHLDPMLTELLQVPAILIVLDVCRSVFWAHRDSYNSEQDPIKVWYLAPACMAIAIPLHASMSEGATFSYFWSCYMYLDVLALLPQVVLMARGDGIVEAPIAHFVAATTLSRLADLWFWYYNFNSLGPQAYMFGFNFSGYLIVFMQVVGLALIGDFMYYYIRARIAGSKLSDDLALPEDDMC